ncbi:hypothetical protein X737_36290 [Mesorhizobium sp. L48C026A00]|nr:hypothetical protein X737_36290 [Mesorhizobium sp. L48C026A00]
MTASLSEAGATPSSAAARVKLFCLRDLHEGDDAAELVESHCEDIPNSLVGLYGFFRLTKSVMLARRTGFAVSTARKARRQDQ